MHTSIFFFSDYHIHVRLLDTCGQFKKMAPVHFEALDPSETALYVWNLSSDIPK